MSARVTDAQLAIHARFGSDEVSSIATELIAARQLARVVKARHVDEHAPGHDEICDAWAHYTYGKGARERSVSTADLAWRFTTEEIAAAEKFGKAATEKCLKAVQESSNLRAQTLNRAVKHFLDCGVPTASLRLEIEDDETRLMHDGVCVARFWIEYDMNAYQVRHHYEGPALP